MRNVLCWTTSVILLMTAMIALVGEAQADGTGDTLIEYNLGLAEQARGNTHVAYKLFKKACMAPDGLADACLSWGLMARDSENSKDMKRAFGSAVMLAPGDIRA